MIHHTRIESLKSILDFGLIAKVPNEFAGIIPAHDRKRRIIWLKEKCEFNNRNCCECDIFGSPSLCLEIDIEKLCKRSLKKIKGKDVKTWWYHIGDIRRGAIGIHIKASPG